jgi:hypothetical protein
LGGKLLATPITVRFRCTVPQHRAGFRGSAHAHIRIEIRGDQFAGERLSILAVTCKSTGQPGCNTPMVPSWTESPGSGRRHALDLQHAVLTDNVGADVSPLTPRR